MRGWTPPWVGGIVWESMTAELRNAEQPTLDNVRAFQRGRPRPIFLKAVAKPMLSNSGPFRFATYLLGCIGFSFGVCSFAQAGLGADPLYVFSTGIQKLLNFNSYAIAEGGFAAVMLAIWAIWNKRLPIISPFVTFVLCGRLIDFGKKHEIASHMPFTHWPLMIMAVVLCAYASSLIIMSGIGIRAMDLVAITMVEKFRREFWIFKTALEVALLGLGWLMLGTPGVQLQPGEGIVMGIGTLFFVVFVDLLIQPFMTANRTILGMNNHGLRGDRSAA